MLAFGARIIPWLSEDLHMGASSLRRIAATRAPPCPVPVPRTLNSPPAPAVCINSMEIGTLAASAEKSATPQTWPSTPAMSTNSDSLGPCRLLQAYDEGCNNIDRWSERALPGEERLFGEPGMLIRPSDTRTMQATDQKPPRRSLKVQHATFTGAIVMATGCRNGKRNLLSYLDIN
ncbi:hypothetical protein OPT61_g1214 [Boeremia exigua]|uniref:Uncharacterized protein n=1 Tax=Boeremia exigua TaxID=749465 RepID=A0ACC2IRF5_9PLEO|nr:hypothetical protein OPT61_g1214 [Boeremia exigua]